MYDIPTDPKKLKQRISRYKRSFKKEQEEHGWISDGAGKRYLLGLLYLLIDDLDGALEYYQWYGEKFPDDIGDAAHYLVWMLVLYRVGNEQRASDKLVEAMLANLFFIPHILGVEQERPDVENGSDYIEYLYLDELPQVALDLCTPEELEWVRNKYYSKKVTLVREKYIEIEEQLKSEPVGPKRSKMVDSKFKLRKLDFSELGI